MAEKANLSQEDRITKLEHCLIVAATVIAENPSRDVKCDFVLWMIDSLNLADDTNPYIDAAKYPDLKKFSDSL